MLTAAVLDADRLARRLLGRGLRRDELHPGGADPTAPASFETSVIRLPTDLATRLRDVAAEIALAQPTQYVCPPETVHVTICGPIHLDDETATAAALDDLRDVAGRLAGGRLRVVRIAVGDTSVFAGVEAVGMDLAAARGHLADRWGVPGRAGPAGAIGGRLFWANLVRFTEPPSPALVTIADRHRRVRHAGFPLEAIELVRTNRAMATAMTTVLGRIAVPATPRA